MAVVAHTISLHLEDTGVRCMYTTCCLSVLYKSTHHILCTKIGLGLCIIVYKMVIITQHEAVVGEGACHFCATPPSVEVWSGWCCDPGTVSGTQSSTSPYRGNTMIPCVEVPVGCRRPPLGTGHESMQC